MIGLETQEKGISLETKIKALFSEKDSPIEFLHYVNYQSLEDVTIDFDGGSRIILSAYNSTGKSAVARGLEVLAYYAYPREYKDHISDDQEECKVEVGLRNGIVITRVFSKKYQYYTVTGLGLDLDTRISEDAYMVMEGNKPPLLVQKLINFAIEPETKQKLNIRYAEDGLLFSRTTGSVNYKTFYNAIDLPELTQAIRTANDDKNELLRSIEAKREKRNILKDKEIRTRIFDSSALEKSLKGLEDSKTFITTIDSIKETINNKNELLEKTPPRVDEIDFSRFSQCSELISLLDRKETYEFELTGLRNVKPVDYTKYSEIENIRGLLSTKVGYEDSVSKTPKVDILDVEDIRELSQLNSLNRSKDEYLKELSKSTFINAINTQILTEIDNIKDLYQNIGKLKNELKTVDGVKELQDAISKSNELKGYVDTLHNMVDNVSSFRTIKSEVEKYDSALTAIKAKATTLYAEVEKYGYVKCPNCNHIFGKEQKGGV